MNGIAPGPLFPAIASATRTVAGENGTRPHPDKGGTVAKKQAESNTAPLNRVSPGDQRHSGGTDG
jgi:hypothetical protein